mmetsp:Transcript_119882/g.219556  ORF Transcript_119882/g.219556 Transcript_119882/m.219556 type:complete len:166 (-) Transcript_119882:26-523(-)
MARDSSSSSRDRSRRRSRRSPSRRRSSSRRRSRSRSRRRSPSRRRSLSPPRRRSPPRQRSPPASRPTDAAAPPGSGPAQTGKAEVVSGKPRQSTGEPTWRAEILMPQGAGANFTGRVRTMCIRGPHRVDKEQAVRDAEQFDEAAAGGDTKKVKDVANGLIRSGIN